MKEEIEPARKAHEEELRKEVEENLKRNISEQVRREELQKLERVNNCLEMQAMHHFYLHGYIPVLKFKSCFN